MFNVHLALAIFHILGASLAATSMIATEQIDFLSISAVVLNIIAAIMWSIHDTEGK